MKTQIKVMPDGFVWRVLTPAEARVLWQTNTFGIYHLDSDGSEHLIESNDDFNEVVDDCVLAIEVGFIEQKNIALTAGQTASFGDISLRAQASPDGRQEVFAFCDNGYMRIAPSSGNSVHIQSTKQ